MALEKQTQKPRLVVAWRPVVSGAVAAAGVAAVIASWPRLGLAPAAPVVLETPAPTPAPVMVPVPASCELPTPEPAPEPPPRFGPGSCPAADPARDPKVGVAWNETFALDDRVLDDHELLGVAASPARHGVLAVWSATRVLVSHDDGKRFRALPPLPAPLLDVALDCHGAVIVLVGDENTTQLGVHERGETRWRELAMGKLEDDDEAVSLHVGGGTIALTASGRFFGEEDTWRSEVRVSLDGGASWREPALDDEVGMIEGMHLDSIDARGRMTIVGYEGDCMYDGTSLFIGSSAARELAGPNISGNYQHHDAAVIGRWVYAGRECEAALCAHDWRANRTEDEWQRAWEPVTGLPDGDELDADVLRGRRPLVHVGRALYQLRGTRAERVEASLPAQATLWTLDSSGRALGLDGDGRLIRWSPRWGTRLLRGQLE